MIWFIGDTEAHYNASDTTPTKVYGHVTLGTPIVRLDRSSDAASKTEYQFHGLANNTLAAVAQEGGTINASFVYAPFGEIIEATDGGAPTAGLTHHRRRMNDKFIDDISGNAYYGFRYYDKTAMIWTQSDPFYRFLPDAAWDQPRRSLLYGFSGQNPLRYIDPDGRDIIDRILRPLVEPITRPAMRMDVQRPAPESLRPVDKSTNVTIAMPGPQDWLGKLATDAIIAGAKYAINEVLADFGTDEAGGGAGGDDLSGGDGGGGDDASTLDGHQVDPWGRSQDAVDKWNVEHQSVNKHYSEKGTHQAITDADDARPGGHRWFRAQKQDAKHKRQEEQAEEKESDGPEEPPKKRRRDDDDDMM